MTTRKHVLDSYTIVAKLPEDPIADSHGDEVRVFWPPKVDSAPAMTMSIRQARQLAYLLCEAADEAERSTARRTASGLAVLCEIAAGAPHAAELAAEALKTKRIEFDRWYS